MVRFARLFYGLAAIIVLVVAAVVVAVGPMLAPRTVLPTPRSSLVARFVEQTDGLYGYRMLRPANWTPLGGGLPQGRLYLAPGFAGVQQGIAVTVVNLQLVAASLDPHGVNAQWLLFRQDATLGGWTAGIEGMWTRDGWSFTLVRTLPHAKIYSLAPPGALPTVYLVAYAIDEGQPFVVVLQASGSYADLGRLQALGIVDDLASMVGSITAIPADGSNVQPPLPTPAPPQPGPTGLGP